MSKPDIYSIFEQYYNKYIDYIRNYCYYKIGDYPDYADDCIQETFRILFEKLSNDIEFTNIKAFLIKTASNFVKLKYREIEKEKHKIISIDSENIQIPYEQKFLEDIPEETIMKLKNEIISSLTLSEQELLNETCKQYKSSYKTTKELSVKYNCSETNIRQRIFLLRTKIKKMIRDKTKNLYFI